MKDIVNDVVVALIKVREVGELIIVATEIPSETKDDIELLKDFRFIIYPVPGVNPVIVIGDPVDVPVSPPGDAVAK